jgi:hypothetical protein
LNKRSTGVLKVSINRRRRDRLQAIDTRESIKEKIPTGRKVKSVQGTGRKRSTKAATGSSRWNTWHQPSNKLGLDQEGRKKGDRSRSDSRRRREGIDDIGQQRATDTEKVHHRIGDRQDRSSRLRVIGRSVRSRHRRKHRRTRHRRKHRRIKASIQGQW